MRASAAHHLDIPPLDLVHPDEFLDFDDIPAMAPPPPPRATLSMPGPDAFQARVIAAADRSIRVIAPAGAGKTQTLVRRVMRRIEEGVAPRRILVLTFDRNAKRSFENMIQKMGMRVSPDIRTLNAFGWDILRRQFPEERFELVKTWQVLGSRGISPERSKHHLIKQFAELGDPKELLGIFDALKDHLFDPRDRAYKKRQAWIVENYRRIVPDTFYQRYGDRYAQEFADAVSDEFRSYERFLDDRKVIDYQDQKLRTLKLLEGDDRQRDLVQRRYDEIIVDEVQDINPLDAELIKVIAEQATLILTGDDDQAIYEFRWASPRFLIDPNAFFGREFTTFELSLNYRCPPKILEHALPLIANNLERVPKQPTAFKQEGGEISLASAPTALDEARSLLTWITEAREKSPELKFQDFAVLYRINAQHYLIQTELFRNRIPYTVNERFDLRIIWRKALTLLELSSKLRGGEPLPPEDRKSLLELYPSFGGLRPIDLNRIVAAGKDTEKFPGTATIAAIGERLSSGAATYFRSAVRALTTARSLDDELQVIGSRFLGFSEQSEQEAVDESPMEELQNIARKMNVPREQFIQRFGRFLYSSTIETGNADDRGVELSTCHGAKGREWQAVILPSCNQGKFPDFRSSQDPQDLEAERRLFYVSMTRSSQRLRISYLKAGDQQEKPRTKPPEPSQFLYEAKLLDEPPARPRQAQVEYEAPSPRSSRNRIKETKTTARTTSSSRTTRGGSASSGGSGAKRSTWGEKSSTARTSSPRSTRRTGATPSDEPVITSAVEEILPPTDVTVPGKPKRRMTFPREGDVRRFVNELTDTPESQRLADVAIEYHYPESTYGVQLALIVRGIPYQIPEQDRLLETPHFAAVYRTLTNAEPSFQRSSQSSAGDGQSPYKGLAIRTLVRVAREFDISSRKGSDVLNDAIRHAIRTNGDGDTRGVRFVPTTSRS